MGSKSHNEHKRRCIKCMEEKNGSAKCPHCGYDEALFEQEALFLRPRTILNGRYLCGLMLGKGGFGITYMGWDLQLHRKLAIKEFFPSALATRHQNQSTVLANSTEDKEFLQQGLRMFLDEARRVAQFHDVEGVVTVHDFFEENNTAYMVMEYLNGSDLNQYVQNHGKPLRWREALRLFRPVLVALKRIHAAEVYHRDISAQNIIITQQQQLKLIDFGAAKYTVRERSDTVRVVKPGYSPLEQYASHGRIGPWTDIYAVGATLYFLMSGSLPPESPDRLYRDELVPLDELDGLDVPEHVSQAVLHCLSVKPDDRYHSIEGLETKLYASHSSISTGAGSLPPPARPPKDGGVPPNASKPEKEAQPGEKSGHNKLMMGLLSAALGTAVALAILFFVPGGYEPFTSDHTKPVKPGLSKPKDFLGQQAYEQAQRHLATLGVYAGPVNGRWDSASREAVKNFQRQENLPATGSLDRKLLALLSEEAQKVQEDKRQAQVQSLLARAKHYLQAKRFEEARRAYNEALSLNAQSDPARQGLIDVESAEKIYDRQRRERELMRKAEKSLAKGDLVQARDYYKQVLALNQGSEEAQRGMQKVKSLIEVEERFERLIRNGKRNLENGNLQMAKRMFQEAQRIKPDSPEVQAGLARLDEAISTTTTTLTSTTTLATTTLPAPVFASVLVDCQPVAEVYLDGKPLGNTPLELQQVPEGTHTIEVRGYGASKSVKVKLQAGKSENIYLTLRGGRLSVNSAPWAEILLDGIQLGASPLYKQNLLLGHHELMARQQGFQSEKKSITLTKGEPVNIFFRLRPIEGE